MVTATDIEHSPPGLVFFNNFDQNKELGKGMLVYTVHVNWLLDNAGIN